MCGLEFLEWLPDFGPARENHVMRSSAVVTSVVYGKGRIEYTTFDAPPGTTTVLRLAFRPDSITACGEPLAMRGQLDAVGYALRELPAGDWLLSIRHDGLNQVTVRGADPQQAVDDAALEYQGSWSVERSSDDGGGSIHSSEQAGAAVVHRFSGNQVRLIGRADPAGGLANVYLDGVKQPAPVDCLSPCPRKQQVLYWRNGLSNGPHELKLVVQGKGHPGSAGKCVYVDAIQWSDAQGKAVFGESGGPAHAQRMIFGRTDRLPYVDSRGNEWLTGTELVIRTGGYTDPVARCWWTEPSPTPITGTPDPELYRYGVHAAQFWVNVTVGPGTYRLALRFAERRPDTDPTRRPQTIAINGRVVAEDLDIASKAKGTAMALDLSFDRIRPRNGIIEIRFTGSDGGEAIVQALEILPEPAAP
jgi:hypothetical protein